MTESVKLADYVDILTGYPFKSSGYTNSSAGVRLLRCDNIGHGGTRWNDTKYWPHDKAPPYDQYRLQAGDVVVAMDRPWIAAGLKHAEISSNDIPSLLVQRVARLRARPGLIQQFLYYLIRSTRFTNHIISVQTGTAIPHISSRQIGAFDFQRPPLGAQKAIVAVLGALDDKIAANERTAHTAHLLAEARYNDLATKATRPLIVGNLLDMKYGKALPAAVRSAGKVAVYGSGGISGSHNEALVTGPGVIVGRKGTVGTVHWSEKEFFPIDTTFWVKLCNEQLSMEFAFFLLRSLGLDSMNSDSAVPGLNRNNVLALPVRVPADKELRSFRDAVRPMFQLREAVSVESALLATLRDMLLPKLMSGELRVRDAEKVVEEAT